MPLRLTRHTHTHYSYKHIHSLPRAYTIHTLATRTHTIHTLTTRTYTHFSYTHYTHTLTTRTHPIRTHYRDTHQIYSPTADNILAIKNIHYSCSEPSILHTQQYKRADQPALAKIYVLNYNELRYHTILLFNTL